MRILSGVIAASFVATVGLAAQQAPPTSSPAAPGGERQQPAPSAQASGQSKTVTLSGCIQNAPAASASASAGGASASASEQKFVLSTKPAAGAAAGSAVGTSGTAMRYQLEGDTKAISPHLNHQVEITGTVENSSASAGASAGAGGAGAASGPMLKVESVKMVAATCS